MHRFGESPNFIPQQNVDGTGKGADGRNRVHDSRGSGGHAHHRVVDSHLIVHGKLLFMLCFLPLTASELAALNPPRRDALVPKTETRLHPQPSEAGEHENQETLDADTRDEAAFLSLELAREQRELPTRLVVSFDLPDGQVRAETWALADSIFVDDSEGRALSADLMTAETQEEADVLLAALYEEPLMWFDMSEREDLVDGLLGEDAGSNHLRL